MRKSKAETAESRAKILSKAAQLLRERGTEGASVAGVMEAAGMTQGGFYRHFKSKDDMLASATRQAFGEVVERFDRHRSRAGAGVALQAYVKDYLSSRHIEHPAFGCPVAAFGCDAGRMQDALGTEFVRGAEELIERAASGLEATSKAGGADARAAAIQSLSMLVGAVVIARALGKSELRSEIVAACKGKLLPE